MEAGRAQSGRAAREAGPAEDLSASRSTIDAPTTARMFDAAREQCVFIPLSHTVRTCRGEITALCSIEVPRALERHLHKLRHSHASPMLAANIHPKVVQERLGRSSISVTMDIYSHLMPNMQNRAAAAVDAAMRAAINRLAHDLE